METEQIRRSPKVLELVSYGKDDRNPVYVGSYRGRDVSLTDSASDNKPTTVFNQTISDETSREKGKS